MCFFFKKKEEEIGNKIKHQGYEAVPLSNKLLTEIRTIDRTKNPLVTTELLVFKMSVLTA